MADIRKRNGLKGTTYQVRYPSKTTKSGYAYATFATLKEARGEHYPPTWFGLFTTAGTPREVIGKINAEVRALFADQAFLDRAIIPSMFESMVSSPEQFADFIKSDSAKWSKVLREANIKAD